ncbi:MAG: hydrogenase maturation protease [Cyanobacteria bacterium P01_E01_bin.6]
MTHLTHHPHHYHFLVIGYGSELRGDDAIGPWVARAVSQWHLPSVQCLAAQQLMPELADYLVHVDYVIFVDACTGSCAPSIQVNPIVIDNKEPDETVSHAMPLMTHHYTPSSLLLLTQQLYGYHPQGWTLQVPAECFSLGDDLSVAAHHGCDRALQVIEQFLQTYQQPSRHSISTHAQNHARN